MEYSVYSMRNYKRDGSSKWKNVYPIKCMKSEEIRFHARITIQGKTYEKVFDDERQAAIFIDKTLLTKNREPINILVKK